MQLDNGRNIQSKGFERRGCLQDPPIIVQNATNKLEARADRVGHKFGQIYEAMLAKYPLMVKKYRRPATNILHDADYVHQGGYDCSRCDQAKIIDRQARTGTKIHFGIIGSSNQIVENALDRDKWHEQKGVICFEMGAAGLLTSLECLAIRGISSMLRYAS